MICGAVQTSPQKPGSVVGNVMMICGAVQTSPQIPGSVVGNVMMICGAVQTSPLNVTHCLFGNINVRCLFTPCHTSGHMGFFVWEDRCPDAPALFSGDTLFVGGCGRFFEGWAEQMYKNLSETLGTLPNDTLAWAKARDEDDITTVPSSLEDEFCYNPFMRVKEEAVQNFTGKTDPVEVMRALRKEKDNLKKPKDLLPIPAILAFQLSLLSRSQPANP
ncbi:hydroxyacylglutathione hydrolase-like protein [Pelodytes ibericus]